MIKSLVRNVRFSSILPWLIAFLVINIVSRGTGGVNSLSRFATMRAMVEQATFQIDDYKDWTVDWARTPDGHYYSNKAPGPMFIGLPLFFLVEQITKHDRKEIVNEEGIRLRPVGGTPQMIISLFLQVIPFLILLVFVIKYMQSKSCSHESISFTALAMLFGNTASVYMNSYFGHGLAAIFLLLLVYAFIQNNWFLMGLAFGLALLSDYGVGLLLFPVLVVLIWKNGKNIKWVPKFISGGLGPGILWVWYHSVCFGSPFSIPGHFQNPLFKDVSHTKNLWGIFHINLRPDVLYELLFGGMRGLLVTQPWMLLAVPTIIYLFLKKQTTSFIKPLYFFGITSFILLLVMNTFFGGWHGGWAAGPRYMSIIFPSLVFLTGLGFDNISVYTRRAMWMGLLVSIVYHGQVYATTILIPDGFNVWKWQWDLLLTFEDKKLWLKLAAFWLVLGVSSFLQYRQYPGKKAKSVENP